MKRVATHTPGALSHDFGGHTLHTKPISVIERCKAPTPYTDDTGRTACHWPARWRSVALEILSLPVPTRDEPAALAGEVTP